MKHNSYMYRLMFGLYRRQGKAAGLAVVAIQFAGSLPVSIGLVLLA